MNSSIFHTSKKYFVVLAFLVLLYISFNILKPFLAALGAALLLAFMFSPIVKRVRKKVSNRTLSALITMIIVLLIIFLPFFIVFASLSSEAIDAYNLVTKDTEFSSVLETNIKIKDYTLNLREYYAWGVSTLYNLFSDNVGVFFRTVSSAVLGFVIIIISLFYFLREGDILIEEAKKSIPIVKSEKELFFRECHDIIYATFYGQLVVALIQGLIGALLFFIFQVPYPLLLGFIMFIFSILPLIGAAFVWIPVGLYLILTGNVVSGILLLIIGGGILTVVYYSMIPYIVRERTNLHPLLVLIGVIGGLKFMGIIGIFIGPLILALTLIFLHHGNLKINKK